MLGLPRNLFNMILILGALPLSTSHYGSGNGTIWLDDVRCTGTETSITYCKVRPWGMNDCGHDEDVGVFCKVSLNGENGTVRLSGGSTSTEGRVEVFHNNTWGTVCDDDFGTKEAAVVCRMLGLPSLGAVPLSAVYYGSGSGTTWLNNVRCTGNETSIHDCNTNPWGNNDCGHHEDVGVYCTDIYECTSEPCKNGGVCANHVKKYICTCQLGYTGINCETDIDECASGPCKNGGSCDDKVNGFTCTCQKGYKGIYCEPACPLVGLNGWVKHGSSCYLLSTNVANITSEQILCNASGGYLAEIEDNAENSFLLEQIKILKAGRDYFIGLNDIEQESTYIWSGTNRLLSQTRFSHWSNGEPNNLNNEDCVVMRRQDGYWVDVPCNSTYPYICEIKY